VRETTAEKVAPAVARFTEWLAGFGETSYDHQSFYASPLGRRAKALYYERRLLGKLATAPMVFCEAFVPSARRLFWKPQRLAIADAHYAMGFAFLAQVFGTAKYHQRAVHFLEVLESTRCQGYADYCWGYPFDWQTRGSCIKEGTPLITTVPYVYEAFAQVYELDADQRWRRIMRSIAQHVFESYRDIEIAPGSATCAYTPDAPDDPGGVINASAYRAFVLTNAALEFSEDKYRETANRNLNFVLASQNPDGSWYYSTTDPHRDFVDHFHTCFVLKALAKIEKLTGSPQVTKAIERGVTYYVRSLFDEDGLPKPFSRAPRLTVYRRELYDYAECINLGVLLRGRFAELDERVATTMSDLLRRWQQPNGSFKSRELLLGWDNVPMHRWAQSQVFRSLCALLLQSQGAPDDSVPSSQHGTRHSTALVTTSTGGSGAPRTS
jgi:hypothetical protein